LKRKTTLIDPKSFYAKLDNILNRIFKDAKGTDFLFTILSALESKFGEAIKIANGRIYEAQGENYVLIYPEGVKETNYPACIPVNSEAIIHVERYGTYIYNDPVLSIDPKVSQQSEYAIPAAFIIESKEENWIFVFDLRAGWVREEMEFCFNQVREALDNRLFSEGHKEDLKQAASIQNSLLPENPPQIPGYDIAFRSRAAEFIVGDFYDFHIFDDESFGVCIGDACGHGLPAALLVRDVVTGLRMGLEKEMKLVYSLKKLNRVIHRSNYSTRFVSLFYCEIQNGGDMVYVNAGHPPVLLFSGQETKQLEATGITLGFLPEIKIHQQYAQIKNDDALVLYSDGVTERQNRLGEDFGMERLKEVVNKNQHKTAAEIVDTLFDRITKFGENKNWQDDTTVLIIKRAQDRV
jgi:sigma-B regulation protein RsbU (phosphoserine phosphatase)